MSDSVPVQRQWPRLATVELGVSDDLLLQVVAARYARERIPLEGLRDIKLVAFLGVLETRQLHGAPGLLYSEHSCTMLGELAGMSKTRVVGAIRRLLECGVLRPREGDTTYLLFSEEVVGPIGAAGYIDWPAVRSRLNARTPALLLLRAVLDAMRAPWEWTALTYQSLAQHACYSVGMAQRGVAQLLEQGVLERDPHAGRGHDYRCSAWALGRVSDGLLTEPALPDSSARKPRDATAPAIVAQGPAEQRPDAFAAPPTAPSSMVVEIGGLVVQVPSGTEIRMTVDADGISHYEVGPHLRFTERSS